MPRENGPLPEPKSEQSTREDIDAVLDSYSQALAEQREHPDDPSVAQKVEELKARLRERSSDLPQDASLDPAYRAKMDEVFEQAESNDIRRRFTDATGDREERDVAAHDAPMVAEGDALLRQALSQKPSRDVDATMAAEAARRQAETSPAARVPDSRDLSYGSLAAAAEMDNVTVELPVDTESLERDFDTHYRRIGNLVVDARRILHDTSITASAALNDLVDRCVEHLAEMLIQRRKMKEAFGDAVRAKRPSEARKVVLDDLKRIGHPGDTPLVADSKDLTADMTYFTVLNFFESNLERLIRKNAKKQ